MKVPSSHVLKWPGECIFNISNMMFIVRKKNKQHAISACASAIILKSNFKLFNLKAIQKNGLVL